MAPVHLRLPAGRRLESSDCHDPRRLPLWLQHDPFTGIATHQCPRWRPERTWSAEAIGMSFSRHMQIYRSDVLFRPRSEAVSGFAPSFIVLDESAADYSSAGWSPQEPASASPAGLHSESTSRNCKPPPDQGWGIFNRRNEDFSTGLDKIAVSRQE